MKILKQLFKVTSLLSLVVITTAASCQQDKYPDFGDGLYAEIATDKDTIVIKLTPEKTPVTVANFVALAEGVHPMVAEKYKGKPFYDSLKFHRVLNDFMIQGGDPLGTGSGDPGYKFESEFDTSLRHDKPGILSMANSGRWATNGSQFFITHKATPWLDGYDENGNLKPCGQPRVSCHSVFGEVVKGQDVVNTIAQGDIMNKVTIIRQGREAKSFDAVKVWETEMPKLEEKRKLIEEESRKKAAIEKEKQEAKAAEVAKEMKPIFDDYTAKAKTMASGLKMHYIKKGTGVKPKIGQTANVNYQGYFTDGKLFDSNVQAVEEKYFMLNSQKAERGMYNPMPCKVGPDAPMVAGFNEAVAAMRVGDEAFIYIPSHLAWGASGRGMIKPNTDVMFIVEMVSIK